MQLDVEQADALPAERVAEREIDDRRADRQPLDRRSEERHQHEQRAGREEPLGEPGHRTKSESKAETARDQVNFSDAGKALHALGADVCERSRENPSREPLWHGLCSHYDRCRAPTRLYPPPPRTRERTRAVTSPRAYARGARPRLLSS